MKKEHRSTVLWFMLLFLCLFGLSQCAINVSNQRAKALLDQKHAQDLKRQVFLEAELIRHCRLYPQIGRIRAKPILSDCLQFLESAVSFDQSFKTPEGENRRDDLLTLFLVMINPWEIPAWRTSQFGWPTDNHLLAFPNVELPKSFQCFFAPETDAWGCQERPHFFAPTSSLGERFVSYFLSKNITFSSHPKEQRDSGGTVRAFIDQSLLADPSTLTLFPDFWTLNPFIQFSVLLHEAKHREFTASHVLCKQNPTYGNSCDPEIEDGPYTLQLIMAEIGIRTFVHSAKEALSKSNAGPLARPTVTNWYAWMFTLLLREECNSLALIVHPPPLPSDLFPCNDAKLHAFVKSHEALFGLAL